MADFSWLFGWAEEHGIEVPKNSNGKADIKKLLEIHKEYTGGSKDYPINTSYSEILSESKSNSSNGSNPPQKVYGFESKKKKNSPDHVRHAHEMGYKHQDEYEHAAVDFWENGQGEIYYGSKRDRFAKYNPKTGEYVVSDKDGTVKTYYKLPYKQFVKKLKQENYEKWKK